MRRKFLLAAMVVVAIGSAVAYWISLPPKEKPPNVVIILVDTLRPDYLGAYGHDPETAPFVSQLAQESTVFTRAFSTSSWTAPATASLFTSTYPTEHGVTMGFFAHDLHAKKLKKKGAATFPVNRIPDEFTTLPEYFKAQGYTTFGLVANRNVGPEMGFTRGFDYFEGGGPGTYTRSVRKIFKELKAWQPKIEASEPYFLYLHLIDVHMPYKKREPYWENLDVPPGPRRRYLSEIGFVDNHIKKIYEEFNLGEEALFVLLSDHGEEFLDHGGKAHRWQLYRELNQVLMLVHSKQLDVSQQRVDLNVSLIDVFPTLTDLCGLPPLENPRGLSLAPLLRTDPAPSTLTDTLRDRTIFAHRLHSNAPDRQFWAATYQNWKLYDPWNQAPELYDHDTDFAEKNNVIDANPEIAESLQKQLAAHKGNVRDTSGSAVQIPLDQELLEELEALGYVE